MRKPLTAKLEIGNFNTRLVVWDERGEYRGLDVMPDKVPYDAPDEQIAAAFVTEADRALATVGLEPAAEWEPAWRDASPCWEYITTLRAAAAER